jgi:hypothetical protein
MEVAFGYLNENLKCQTGSPNIQNIQGGVRQINQSSIVQLSLCSPVDTANIYIQRKIITSQQLL